MALKSNDYLHLFVLIIAMHFMLQPKLLANGNVTVPVSSDAKIEHSPASKSPLLKNESELLLKAGSAFGDAIKKKHPKAIIVGYCSGSFEHTAHEEKIAGLYDPTSSKVMIISIMENRDVHLIQEQSKKIEKPEDFEVQCLSTMEVQRRSRAFKMMEGFSGQIKSISPLDVYCYFIDMTSVECRGFNPKTKKWQPIGGWTT